MKTAYVVLGMHRSGTSSVAGALVLLGATPPRTLMPPRPENPKGFWESERIMVVNDRILAHFGSSWRDWRPLGLEGLTGKAADALRALALDTLDAEFGGADSIVLKDPRICRLYPFWRGVLEAAGYEPLVVSPIRPPIEVAASLTTRDAVSQAEGLRLWLRHVLEAEAASRGWPRHLMAWNDFLTEWPGQVALMSERLNRPLSAAGARIEIEMDAFLNADLRHQRGDGSEANLPPDIARSHAALLDLALGGESAGAHDRLDLLRARFDETSAPLQDPPKIG